MGCLSSGECAGALQGGSVCYGLQARQRTCRPETTWNRDGGGKTLEKTRQREQEGENTPYYQASGRLKMIRNQSSLNYRSFQREWKNPQLQFTRDSKGINAEQHLQVDVGPLILCVHFERIYDRVMYRSGQKIILVQCIPSTGSPVVHQISPWCSETDTTSNGFEF